MVYAVRIFDLISIENAFKWLFKSVIYFSKKDTFRFWKWNILILRLYIDAQRSCIIIKNKIAKPSFKIDQKSKPKPKFVEVLLKIKNDSLSKIEASHFEFINSKYVLIKEQNDIDNSTSVQIYNLKNDKLFEPKFNDVIENTKSKSFYAKTGKHFDVEIDSLSNVKPLKHYFDYIKNDYFYYKDENDQLNVMNQNFEIAKFSYPDLEPYYAGMYGYDRINALPYFKFNTEINRGQNGLIDFDGNILANPGEYDFINMPNMDNSSNKVNYNSNFCKKYKNKIFIGYKNENKRIRTTIFTADNQKIISVDMKEGEVLEFGKYNDVIVLKSQDSVKVIDIITKQYILKLKCSGYYKFGERPDGSYTEVVELDKNKTRRNIYTTKGDLLTYEIITEGNSFLAFDKKNYIIKKNKKYGVVNAKEEVIIPFIYEDIKGISDVNFIAKRNGSYGVIDEENQILLDFVNDTIIGITSDIKECSSPYCNNVEMLKVKKSKLFGLISAKNYKTVFPTDFNEIKYCNDKYILRKDSSYIFIWKDYFKKEYEKLVIVAADSVTCNRQYYKKGKLFQMSYDPATRNMVWSSEPSYIAGKEIKDRCVLKDGKYYFVNNNKSVDTSPVISVVNKSIRNLETNKDDDFYIVGNEKGKFMLCDEKLNLILPFDYDEIIMCNNTRYIIVKKNNKYGVVNYENKVILPFIYDTLKYKQEIFEGVIGKMFYKISPDNVILFEKDKVEYEKEEKKVWETDYSND